MILYHGSDKIIKSPLHNGSRLRTDFGKGFYLTQDYGQAKRWSLKSRRDKIVNKYDLKIDNLNVFNFGLDIEWILFIAYNRDKAPSEIKPILQEKFSFLENYDVLIGPTADDKLYNTIEEFFSLDKTLEEALDILNCMKLSNQYLVKTKEGIDNLIFDSYESLDTESIEKIKYDNDVFRGSISGTIKSYRKKNYDTKTYFDDIIEVLKNEL
ncbi:MAG: DUF3990 domain-containing protein [Peptostreptococcaceae bacterium]